VLAREIHYEPLPPEARTIVIAAWTRGELLRSATIGAMVPTAEFGGNGMPDELTDYQIALLCDIEEGDLTKFAGDRKRDLERLLSEGYVEPTQSHPGSALRSLGRALSFSACAVQG
jgi:hypothetical protein